MCNSEVLESVTAKAEQRKPRPMITEWVQTGETTKGMISLFSNKINIGRHGENSLGNNLTDPQHPRYIM